MLRALARRWLFYWMPEHDEVIAALVQPAAPALPEAFGIGVDTAAEILIVVGDNPERIHSQVAFAKLAGVAPMPASCTVGRAWVDALCVERSTTPTAT